MTNYALYILCVTAMTITAIICLTVYGCKCEKRDVVNSILELIDKEMNDILEMIKRPPKGE